MDVLRYVRMEYGVQYVMMMTGTLMMLELRAENLDMTMKVYTHLLNYYFKLCKIFSNAEVKETAIFGPGGSVMMSHVQCSGLEKQFNLCDSKRIENSSCDIKDSNSAGVICSNMFGMLLYSQLACLLNTYFNTDVPSKCIDEEGTPPLNQSFVMNMERCNIFYHQLNILCAKCSVGLEIVNNIWATIGCVMIYIHQGKIMCSLLQPLTLNPTYLAT